MPFSKKFFILTVIPIIASIILIVFIIWPALNSLWSLAGEVEKKNDEFKIYREQNVSPDLITAKLNKYLKDAEFINKSAIKKENQLEFIKFLENLDTKHLLTSKVDLNVPYSIVRREQDKDKKAETKITRININISLMASFDQFLNYLIDISQADYYININSINMSVKDKGDLTAFSYKRAVTDSVAEPDQAPDIKDELILFINLSAETYWVD